MHIDSIAIPEAMVDQSSGTAVGKTCGSNAHLTLWDGLICLHYKRKIKTIGANTIIERPFKYW